MLPKKRTRRQHPLPPEDSDLDYQHSYDPNSEGKRSQQTRTRAAKNKVNYTAMDEPSKENNQQQESIQEQVQYPQVYNFLTPIVQSLLWKIQNEDPEQEKYLVKFMKKSYHQSIWMTRKQLKNIGFQVNSNTNKSLKIKMRKTMQLKLKEGEYFNPNFLIPDRILSSTEIFTAIHHKRANDIKGKWDETILIVVQKILNFVKNGYPYGILLHQPYNEELQKQVGIQQPINIGQIISKVYLGYYKNHFQFWVQLGRAIRNYLLIYPQEKGDYFIVGSTIRECAIFLYQQWHFLCHQRYLQLRGQLIASKVIPDKMIDQQENDYKPQKSVFLVTTTPNIVENQTTAKIINKPINSEQTSFVTHNGVNIPPISQDTMTTAIANPLIISQKEQENVINSEKAEQNGKSFNHQSQNPKSIQISIFEQFCQTNIFLTEKSVDTPTNEQQFQLLNPGRYSFDWLSSQNLDQFKEIEFQYINRQDMMMLDINTEIEKLYYVKWKDLSYNDITWQSQRYINSPEKIQQFKTWNKIPVKEIRERFEMHNKVHKFLIEYNQYIGDKKNQVQNVNVSKMEIKMYRLDANQKGTARQYGDKDIPIFKNYRKLKDFQLESLNWLIKSWYENKNTILADEMGLGKTIQTIAFLYHLYTYEHVIGPFLILAPLTTLQQWRREIEEWTNFNCLLYYDEGRGDVREIIQEYQFFHLHTTKTGDIISSKLPKFQILLTNYQLFVNDFEVLYRIPFQHIVLDQAHRLKNRNTKTTITLARLPCVRKTLLTGTPIQNNTKELWTLLNFIEPRAFANEEQFLQEYAELSTQEQVKNFKKMLKPYLLRRVKEDVESTIPKLSETIIDVQMSALQKAYYKGIFQKNKTMLKSLSSANFNSISIQLRKCCNHPYLISPETEAQIKYGAVTEQEETNKFIKASGKTILLMKLLQKFKKEGKKVLLFSQFVLMLDLLKPYLQVSGFNCQILKGSQSSTTRHQAITRFTQQETDIFLISTKAGGVGINLVAATEIVIYDSDWNPQNDIQATARAHRIGQKKQVNVYRLITANSYESEMFQMSSKKLGLDKAIFTGDTFKSMGEFDDAQKQLTKIEIQMLLKKGIIGFLDNQINEEQYFSQPIEDILEKNARKVEYAISQSSCTFSKTKFKSDQANDIKMDAPDFWEQALKDIETPLDRLVKKRTQLKQYHNIESQQALMLQTYRIVLQFVKHKTLGTGFNAQEQRNLLRFLQAINSQRHINRQLRDIADLLSLQIIKPSRRFKVKEEDIFSITNTHSHQLRKQTPIIDKNLRIKRLKRHHEEVENLGLEPQPEDEDSGVQEEPYEDSPKSQEVQKNDEQEKIDEEFQRLCTLCEKPKCSIFCGGVCGRAFHKKCFQAYNSNSSLIPQTYQLDEVVMQAEKLKESKLQDLLCITCKEKTYNFKCSICLKEGKYVEEDAIPPSKSKKHQKIKKEPKQADQNSVFKCSFPGKCHRFYHLACLFSEQFQGKFSDHTGKVIKDITAITRQFRCPSHYCNSCYGIDSKSTKLKSYTCIRCCRTFHDKCLDKEKFHRLGSQHYYLCADHLRNAEQIDRMTIQLRKFMPNKKDRLEQKKRAKQAKKYRAEVQSTVKQKQIKRQEKLKQKDEDTGLRRSKRIRGGEVPQESEIQKKVDQKEGNQMIEQKQEHGKSTSQVDQNGQSKTSFESKKSRSKSKKNAKQHKELMNISEKSEKQKSKNQSKDSHRILEWSYEDYKLTPIAQFDYSEYIGNWCRYCGARYANKFQEGPWQSGKLCEHHFQQWKKGRLRLQKYKSLPKKPINKSKQNELRFLNDFSKKNNHTPEQTIEILNKNQGSE